MSCLDEYSGGNAVPFPPRVQPVTWRDFGALETALLKSYVEIGAEARLYGALPGVDLVGQFVKATSGRVDISSVQLDLSVVDPLAPPFSDADFIELGAASPAEWSSSPVGLYLDGTGQILLRALGLFGGVGASILVRCYTRLLTPASGGYLLAGFAFNSRTESALGGIGQNVVGTWYRRRALGDPAATLTTTGPVTVQNQVADPINDWEPWTLWFSAHRVNGAGAGEASLQCGGWRGFETAPAGDTAISSQNTEIGWDSEDREVIVGAWDIEMVVQQIEVHSRGL